MTDAGPEPMAWALQPKDRGVTGRIYTVVDGGHLRAMDALDDLAASAEELLRTIRRRPS